MKGFKEPGFQDRAAASAKAKTAALEKLKAAPKRSPEEIAAALARQQEREAAAAAKRAAAKAAIEAAKQAKLEEERLRLEEEERIRAEQAANAPVPKSEAELKAARDARYAARKAAKSKNKR